MKKILFIAILFFVTTTVSAQQMKLAPIANPADYKDNPADWPGWSTVPVFPGPKNRYVDEYGNTTSVRQRGLAVLFDTVDQKKAYTNTFMAYIKVGPSQILAVGVEFLKIPVSLAPGLTVLIEETDNGSPLYFK